VLQVQCVTLPALDDAVRHVHTVGYEVSMPTPTNNSDGLTAGSDEASRAPVAQPPSAAALDARRVYGSRSHYFDSKLKMLPGVSLPLRSMLVTGRGQQILVSPVGTSEEASYIGSEPLTLVAPSLLHHLHLPAAVERFHPVALWGPPGLPEKLPALGPIRVLGVDPWPHADQLEFVVIEGAAKRNEVVFFHRASRTIYTADLFFNIREPGGILTSLALRFMGLYRRFGASRLWRSWVTDRAAFTRSIEAVLAWDFDRIVVAHGEVLEYNARDQFEISLRELGLLE
jgi:hypothetical protein